MNPDAIDLIPYDGQGPTTEVLSIMKIVVSLTSENKYKEEMLICYFGSTTATEVSNISYWRNGSATN